MQYDLTENYALKDIAGIVIETLPNAIFIVKLENGEKILGYIASRANQRYIKVLPGDRVKVELSPYNFSRGRITYRVPKSNL